MARGVGGRRHACDSLQLSNGEVRDKIAGGWVGSLVAAAWAYPTEFEFQGRIMPARDGAALERAVREPLHLPAIRRAG